MTTDTLDEGSLSSLMQTGELLLPQGAVTQLPARQAEGPPREGSPARARLEPEGRVKLALVSIVIPALNEAQGLPGLLEELRSCLSKLDRYRFEVLVIDDGSSDHTGALATEFGARVFRHPAPLGNGASIKHGIREARGDYILLMDADGQHPPEVIPRLLDELDHYDMVVASRGARGGKLHRNIANRVYNGLASYVTGKRIPDLTSGFRVLRADPLRSFLPLLPNTFSYPTTITLSMFRAGYSVRYVPFQVREREGKSKIRILKDGSRFLMIILKIATLFAPLRIFTPVAAAIAGIGAAWYLYTFFSAGRFTNMAVMLFVQASVIFSLGLISEQIAQMRFERTGDYRPPSQPDTEDEEHSFGQEDGC